MAAVFNGPRGDAGPAVAYERDSGVGLIALCDAAGGNRLNPDSLAALRAALEGALADPAVRVVALRADGPAGTPFCLGMDLDKLKDSLDGGDPALRRRQAVQAYGDLLELIGTCDKPVAALVGGPVKAGGVGLVAACDLVLAAESASFELSEVLFGLIPANVLPYLLGRRIGVQKARYLILSARCLDAAQATAVGLADQCFADADAESAAKSLFKAMLRAEPGALAETKRFLTRAEGLERGELRALGVETLLGLMDREAVGQALAAFSAGETPAWFGRFKPTGPVFWRNNG